MQRGTEFTRIVSDYADRFTNILVGYWPYSGIAVLGCAFVASYGLHYIGKRFVSQLDAYIERPRNQNNSEK